VDIYEGILVLIIHFTTVHARTDTRIRVKQAASLAAETGGRVALFVQDGQGGEKDTTTGLEVVDTGPRLSSRSLRMSLGAWRMWRAVRRARHKVAHFHDPELIPVGLLLKLSGVKVVYDVHEDVPRQILGKFWIPVVFRKTVAWAMEAVEWIAGRCFDAIVPATSKIANRFPVDKTVVVQNFPLLQELVVPDSVPYDERPPHFAYVGGITRARGAKEMVAAIGILSCGNAVLRLAGAFSPQNLQAEIEGLEGWKRVDFLGWADRKQVAGLLGNVRAGLVLFQPGPNHCSAQPNKMFEYMAAGLPVIASDFALWREIVDGAGCGILVDPQDPDAIARAMQWMLDHPDEAEAMGRRGRAAVEEKYNWEREAEKLIGLYKELMQES
jgi:glycosyltransferase involved in cell wall biosynthesis